MAGAEKATTFRPLLEKEIEELRALSETGAASRASRQERNTRPDQTPIG